VQVSSPTSQGRSPEAVAVGVELVRQLGLEVPPRDRLDDEIERRLDDLYRWLDKTTVADDLSRTEITEPALHAVGALMNRIMPPAFFRDQAMMNWLSLEAL